MTVPVGPVPLDAAVIRPFEFTVMLAFVYEPGVTFEFLNEITIFDPAPLSTESIGKVVLKYLLFGSNGSVLTNTNSAFNKGPEAAAIAPVVVFTVMPLCTIGTCSLPTRGLALGNWVICTFAILVLVLFW